MLRAPPGAGAMHHSRLSACRCTCSAAASSSGPNLGGKCNQGGGGPLAPQRLRHSRQVLMKKCRRSVECSAAGSGGNNASKVLAWAVNAARRTLKLMDSSSEVPQQVQLRTDETASDAAQPSGEDATADGSGSSAREAARDQHQESFESWREFIEQMDETVRASIELDELLAQAVAEERFEDATRLRRQLEDMLARDTVGAAMEELDDALTEERYEDAARIRDESYTNLLGWWAGRGENDPYGHLLHISAGFSCYTGRAYLPKSLFEIKDCVNSGQLPEDDVPSVLLNMGQPFMELFLRMDEQTGRLRSCATAIVPADFVKVQRAGRGDDSGSGSPDEETSTGSVQIQVTEGDGGPEAVKIHMTGTMAVNPEDIQGKDPSEVLEVLKDEVLRQFKASLQQQQQQRGESGDRDAFGDITDLSEVLSALQGSNNGSPQDLGANLSGLVEHLGASGGTFNLGDADGNTITVEVASDAQEMARNAADLRMFGKDRFVIQALKHSGVWDGEAEEQEEGDNGPDGVDQIMLDALTAVAAEEADSRGKSAGPELKSQFAIGRKGLIPIVDILGSDSDVQQPEDKRAELARLREAVVRELRRLRQAHAAGSGPAVDRNTVLNLIQKVRRDRLAAKQNAATSQEPVVGAATLDPSTLFKGRITYKRIPSGLSRTDPFSGLYLAAFGPHGIEMLLLSRSVSRSGNEIVTARKLTGDPNVPAGEISFTANIDRSARLDVSSEYPEVLGVTARYAGRGLVAQPGFTEPKWVEGEVLQFAEASPVTQGARLGFVWAVPGQRRYLVLLSRVDLDSEL